jgi:hypothetical protein
MVMSRGCKGKPGDVLNERGWEEFRWDASYRASTPLVVDVGRFVAAHKVSLASVVGG